MMFSPPGDCPSQIVDAGIICPFNAFSVSAEYSYSWEGTTTFDPLHTCHINCDRQMVTNTGSASGSSTRKLFNEKTNPGISFPPADGAKFYATKYCCDKCFTIAQNDGYADAILGHASDALLIYPGQGSGSWTREFTGPDCGSTPTGGTFPFYAQVLLQFRTNSSTGVCEAALWPFASGGSTGAGHPIIGGFGMNPGGYSPWISIADLMAGPHVFTFGDSSDTSSNTDFTLGGCRSKYTTRIVMAWSGTITVAFS